MIPIPPPGDHDAEALEMTPTLKGATALHLLRTHGSMTTADMAQALGCHPSTAYRVLMRIVLSRRFVIAYDRPYWHISEEV